MRLPCTPFVVKISYLHYPITILVSFLNYQVLNLPTLRNSPQLTVFELCVTNAFGQQLIHGCFFEVLEFVDLFLSGLNYLIHRGENGCDFLLFWEGGDEVNLCTNSLSELKLSCTPLHRLTNCSTTLYVIHKTQTFCQLVCASITDKRHIFG